MCGHNIHLNLFLVKFALVSPIKIYFVKRIIMCHNIQGVWLMCGQTERVHSIHQDMEFTYREPEYQPVLCMSQLIELPLRKFQSKF